MGTWLGSRVGDTPLTGITPVGVGVGRVEGVSLKTHMGENSWDWEDRPCHLVRDEGSGSSSSSKPISFIRAWALSLAFWSKSAPKVVALKEPRREGEEEVRGRGGVRHHGKKPQWW
jgi:hypothetical protein